MRESFDQGCHLYLFNMLLSSYLHAEEEGPSVATDTPLQLYVCIICILYYLSVVNYQYMVAHIVAKQWIERHKEY